jgi:membrane peptidoglycan carboxypeptidase
VRKYLRWSVVVLSLGFVYVCHVYLTLPDVRPLAHSNPNTTAFMQLRKREAAEAGRRFVLRHQWVPYTHISNNLRRAVLVAEDSAFFDHEGIDLKELRASLEANWEEGRFTRGGSTITQQLVRILYLDRQQTLARKIREAALALWLETKLSKHEILTRYLNNVYLGAGATGMPAAALTYFGKDTSDLTLAESALLAGLIVAPSYLNPRHNPVAARARAALVLDAMVANGRLDAATAKAAKDRPARLAPKPAVCKPALGSPIGSTVRQLRSPVPSKTPCGSAPP